MAEQAIGMRVKRWVRNPAIWCVAVVGLFAGLAPGSHATTPMQLTYRVTHSTFGNIGTYVNTIEPGAGGATTVQTRAHFEVKMLGVTLHREDAQRTERWQGNRLISFSGVTNKGSGSTVLKGEARGNSFVISSPAGTVTAPATVHPANPWSANFLNSNTMMRPDSGRLEKVNVSGGEESVVTIDGTAMRARKYEVSGDGRYTVWIDAQGVPVQFIADDNGGKVTFTLTSCVRCDVPALQQAELK